MTQWSLVNISKQLNIKDKTKCVRVVDAFMFINTCLIARFLNIPLTFWMFDASLVPGLDYEAATSGKTFHIGQSSGERKISRSRWLACGCRPARATEDFSSRVCNFPLKNHRFGKWKKMHAPIAPPDRRINQSHFSPILLMNFRSRDHLDGKVSIDLSHLFFIHIFLHWWFYSFPFIFFLLFFLWSLKCLECLRVLSFQQFFFW